MDGGAGFEQGVDMWMRTDPTLGFLEEQAVSLGLDPARVEEAVDGCTGDDPRRDVVKLILAATAAKDAQAARAELSQLSKLGEIKSRAEAWGVDMEELKQVMRTAKGNPRAAAVEFIVNAIASGAAAGTAAQAPTHFLVQAESGAIVRAGVNKASKKVNKIAPGTVVEVSELKRTTTGTLRAKTKDGWVTAVTKTGKELLVETEIAEPASEPEPEPLPEPGPSHKLDDGLGATPAGKAPTPQQVQPEPERAEDLTASAPPRMEHEMSEEDRGRLVKLQGMGGEELKQICDQNCSHLKSGTKEEWEHRARIMRAIKEGDLAEAARLIMWAWKDGEAKAAGDLRRQFSYGPSTRQEQKPMQKPKETQKREREATQKVAEDEFAEKILSKRQIGGL